MKFTTLPSSLSDCAAIVSKGDGKSVSNPNYARVPLPIRYIFSIFLQKIEKTLRAIGTGYICCVFAPEVIAQPGPELLAAARAEIANPITISGRRIDIPFDLDGWKRTVQFLKRDGSGALLAADQKEIDGALYWATRYNCIACVTYLTTRYKIYSQTQATLTAIARANGAQDVAEYLNQSPGRPCPNLHTPFDLSNPQGT